MECIDPPQTMPDAYKHCHVLITYRNYYNEDNMKKREIVKHSKRDAPRFIEEINTQYLKS